MADSTSYPKIPAKAWVVLRAKAAGAPTTRFTPAVVAAALGMGSAESARNNVVRHLRRIGLINDDGALTEIGNLWRVDATYGKACEQIVQTVYPVDLAALTTASGDPDKAQVETWFQHQGFGGSNASQMASTYVMLAQGKIPESPTQENKTKSLPKERASTAPSEKRKERVRVAPDLAPSPSGSSVHETPSVHIDIQIHIPAAATPEQIDSIFASMAKHLYQR